MLEVAMQSEPLPRWKISLERYHHMIEAGVLTTQDRVQLIAGEIVPMSPIGIWHSKRTFLVTEVLRAAFDNRFVVWESHPLALPDHSEPEPDVSVVKREQVFAKDAATDWAALVVEVADSSLSIDRRKAAVYASADIPEYWIVNRTDDVLEVYRTPKAAADVDVGAAYREVLLLRRGDVVKPLLGTIELAVTEILGEK